MLNAELKKKLKGRTSQVDVEAELKQQRTAVISSPSTADEVANWLNANGFDKAAKKLGPVTGESLLAMSKPELKQRTDFPTATKLFSRLEEFRAESRKVGVFSY